MLNKGYDRRWKTLTNHCNMATMSAPRDTVRGMKDQWRMKDQWCGHRLGSLPQILDQIAEAFSVRDFALASMTEQ